MFGRALVLAKIDEKKENLITMLAGTEGQTALSDEQLLEIDRKLLVRDRKELEEKFPDFCSRSCGIEEQKETVIIDNFAKRMESQAKGQFEVWYRKEKSMKNIEIEDTTEQRKKTELYMGIRTFLEHSKEKSRGLLFLNMSPEEFLKAKNKNKLELYFNTVNHKAEDTQAIQLAILPEVAMGYGKSGIRERFSGTKEQKTKQEKVRQTEVIQTAAMLVRHKVLLCYQYETGEETSAETFAKEGREYYQKESAVYEGKEYSEYMCCCYPNLSSRKNSMYLGAAFIAAGMLASGSREGEQSVLPKELYPYAERTKEELQREKYGCCLSSETAEKGWAAIPHMVLFSARTLAWKHGSYQQVEEVFAKWKEREM